MSRRQVLFVFRLLSNDLTYRRKMCPLFRRKSDIIAWSYHWKKRRETLLIKNNYDLCMSCVQAAFTCRRVRDSSRQRNSNINRDPVIATNWLSKCRVSLMIVYIVHKPGYYYGGFDGAPRECSLVWDALLFIIFLFFLFMHSRSHLFSLPFHHTHRSRVTCRSVFFYIFRSYLI